MEYMNFTFLCVWLSGVCLFALPLIVYTKMILAMTQIEFCYVEQRNAECALIFGYRKVEIM